MPAVIARRRTLLEQVDSRPRLKIDKARGIIYRVRVLGRYSKNSHGVAEAENGTEYTPTCMRDARALYEGQKVKVNHPPNRLSPTSERDVHDIFGKLKNVRYEDDALWADLHYLKAHPLAPRVVEDAERGLGVFGLSHNAAAARERMDARAGRLIIEQIGVVRSVDLVDPRALGLRTFGFANRVAPR